MTKAELDAVRHRVYAEVEGLLPSEQIYCADLSLRFTDPLKYLDEGGNISHPGGSSCDRLRPGHISQLPLDDLIDLRDYLAGRRANPRG